MTVESDNRDQGEGINKIKGREYKDINNTVFTPTNNKNSSSSNDINVMGRNIPSHLYSANYSPGQNTSRNILDLHISEYHTLHGLGKPIDSLPRNSLAAVRSVFIQLSKNFLEAANDQNMTPEAKMVVYKKLIVAPTILFLDTLNEKLSRCNTILERCNKILNDDYSSFTLDTFAGRYKPKNTQVGTLSESAIKSKNDDDAFLMRKVKLMMQKGEISKAFQIAGQSTVHAPASLDTFDHLQSLHPQRTDKYKPNLSKPSSFEPFSYTLDVTKIKRVISGSSRGTKAGPDNLSTDILRQLLFSNEGRDFTNQASEYAMVLTSVTDHLFNDPNIPWDIKGFFGSGLLYGLQQKIINTNAGQKNKIRPITNGLGLRKAIEKVGSITALPAVAPLFEGIQLGVGNSSGCDKFVHTTRFISNNFPDITHSLSDFKTAFQLIERGEVENAMHEICPILDNLMETILHPIQALPYGGLVEGIQCVENGSGVHQGAVLSSLSFALTILPTCVDVNKASIDAAPGKGASLAYLDDMRAFSSVKGISDGIKIILRDEYKGEVLQLQKHIIKLGLLDNVDSVHEAVKIFAEFGIPESQILIHPGNGGDPCLYGTIVMGVPEGTDEFIAIQTENILRDLGKSFDTVDKIARLDPHTGLHFLSKCLPGQIMHILRGLTPEHSQPIATFFDKRTDKSFAVILGVNENDLNVINKTVTKLALNDGGIGLCLMSETVDAAYVAGFTASLECIRSKYPDVSNMLLSSNINNPDIPKGVSSFIKAVGRLNVDDPSITVEGILRMKPQELKHFQQKISKPKRDKRSVIFKKMLQNKRDDASSRDLAMHLSCGGPDASAWVKAIGKDVNTTMSKACFQRALKNRILFSDPIYAEGDLCSCGTPIDEKQRHFATCKKLNILAIVTHTRLQDAIQQFTHVTSSKIVIKEPKKWFAKSDPVTEMRLDLVFVESEGGKAVGYDVTVTHPVPANLTWNKSQLIGRAAADAEKRKILSYKDLCDVNDITFVPVAYEVGGRVGLLWRKEMERLFNMHPEGGHAGFRDYWRMRISVALQTGISNAMLSREALILERKAFKASGGRLPVDASLMTDLGSYINIRGGGVGWDSS